MKNTIKQEAVNIPLVLILLGIVGIIGSEVVSIFLTIKHWVEVF